MPPNYKFIVEVDREHSDELRELLREQNVYKGEIIRKALDIPSLIIITAATLNIIDIIRRWYKDKQKESKNPKVRIFKYNETKFTKMGKEIQDFEKKSLEEIEVELKEE